MDGSVCAAKHEEQNYAAGVMSLNVLRVAAVGDFGALHCHPAQKFDSSTQLQFCTSPPIEATRCYLLAFCPPCHCKRCQY
ncbi:MAG: hypothetical protein LC115_13525 [Bacteroidia bacterium]|nr:hypothetical protein [Bacteroidia bacterium]